MTDIVALEFDLLAAADGVARAEKKMAEEYLLHVAAGQHTWAAQKMAENRHGHELRVRQAEYEIALARLRRA